MYTVYAFYKDGEMRGYTIDKEIAKMFKAQRPKVKSKIFELDEIEFSGFCAYASEFQLFDNVINDESKDYRIITTYKENDKLESIITAYDSVIHELYSIIVDAPIKRKKKEVLLEALESYGEDNWSNFDTFKILIYRVFE